MPSGTSEQFTLCFLFSVILVTRNNLHTHPDAARNLFTEGLKLHGATEAN
jgi:hypothetical protein